MKFMAHSESKKVLIVDDDPGLQFVVGKRLKSAGFECGAALTVEEGLEMVRNWKPDLIVLDLGFVGADGADFLQSVREWTDEGQKTPPIIVLSCYNERDIVDYALDLGACGFVAKPYDATDLVSQIRERLLQHAS
jgi:two-component system KDP operon response regulator KdpE